MVKKKGVILIISVIAFIVFLGSKNTVSATQVEIEPNQFYIYYQYDTENTGVHLQEDEVLNVLESDFGYTGELGTAMRLDTWITVVDRKNGRYGIKIGNLDMRNTSYLPIYSGKQRLTYDDLCTYFLCDYSDEELQDALDRGATVMWRVVIVANAPEVYWEETLAFKTIYVYAISIVEVDSPDDVNESLINDNETVDLHESERASDIVQDAVDAAGRLLDKITQNPVGTFFTIVLDGLKISIGDTLQKMAQLFNEFALSTFASIEYTYDTLEAEDADDSDSKNKYTNVEEGNDTEDYEYSIIIENNDEQFASLFLADEPKIPVLSVDLYNMAVGNIRVFDANFLTGDQTLDEDGNPYHEEDSPWMTIRNIGTTVIHVVIYLTSAVLLTTLIWHGIHIVKHSIDNPKARAKHMKALSRFAISLLMLIGSVVIMALCIFASDMFFEDVGIDDTDELPIRVYVEEQGYSFSTNFTGYVRFMSEIQNVDLLAEKAMYTVFYIVLAAVNLVAAGMMFIRMILMLVLGMVGPILAGLHALHLEGHSPLSYRSWVIWYIRVAAIQIIFAIIYRIVLECL